MSVFELLSLLKLARTSPEQSSTWMLVVKCVVIIATGTLHYTGIWEVLFEKEETNARHEFGVWFEIDDDHEGVIK